VQEHYRRALGGTPALTDESTAGQVDTAAAALREAMTVTLDKWARRKRTCARLKRWWTADLAKLREELGAERRRPAGIGRVQDARRILQEAEVSDVWTASGYTVPRIDREGQVLIAEDGTVAEGRHDREQAVLRAHFPVGPPGTYASRGGGDAYRRVDAELVGTLLGKAASGSAPGDDHISAAIVKVFWQWDEQRITQVIRACI